MKTIGSVQSQPGERAREIYAQLRSRIETPENLGKLVVIDVDSGDYEIDEAGIESSRRLYARRPGASLYALRIGYKAVESFRGLLERSLSTHGAGPVTH